MDAAKQDRLQTLYSDSWIRRLKNFVARRYHDFGDWEGWFEEAHQNLALKVNAMPVDQDVSDALIFAVFKNELITVKRNRLGYPRPRAWLREFSELGQDLFEWMCLQKLSREKIIELAERKLSKKSCAGNASTSGDAEENEDSGPSSHKELLIELTNTMIEKKECDGVRPTTSDIDDEAVGQLASGEPTVEDHTDHAQLGLMLSMLLGSENITDEVRQQAAERLKAMRASLGEEALLNDMDILILRCYYYQGMSQNDVAKLVKMPLQKVVRQREAAVKRIRKFMEANNLTKESFGL